MPSFKLKSSWVTILQGVEFSIFPLILAWALQQCSATALPVIKQQTVCDNGTMLSCNDFFNQYVAKKQNLLVSFTNVMIKFSILADSLQLLFLE